MTTKGKASSSKKKVARKMAPAKAWSTSFRGKKQAISPKERWLLISENAYARAQRRGFVGGDPFDEWVKAEREIDAKYVTDFHAPFAMTDAGEISEQFKGIFAGYASGQLGLDMLLNEHRVGLEKLAAFNRSLLSGTSELASRQTRLLQGAVSEAVKILHSFSQGKMDTDGVAKQAELSMQAIGNVLSLAKTLAESATGLSPVSEKAKGSRRTKRPPTSSKP